MPEELLNSAANEDVTTEIDDFEEEIEEVDDNLDTDADSEVNDENIESTSEDYENQESSPEETHKTKDATKAYSERLKKDRREMEEKLKAEFEEKQNKLARARGFDSWAELEEYSENERLSELGIEDKDAFKSYLEQYVDTLPEIVEYRKILKEQQAKEQERMIDEEITKISKIDSSISSLKDLQNHPSFNAIVERVKNGQSVYDAYRLENFEALALRNVDSAKQEVYNNINNKNHMKPINGAGATTDVVVPEDVYMSYKINTNMTDEQIKKHYAQYVKENN